MNKKAQGALEFLMTYGWAFLVILIMIGALAYFGVLNPQRFLPERCTISSGIACESSVLGATDVKLLIRNNMGESITITGLAVADQDNLYSCGGTAVGDLGSVAAPVTDLSTELEIPDGSTATLYIDTCANGGIASGNKFKVLPTITYYNTRAGAAFAHDVTGELFAEVQ